MRNDLMARYTIGEPVYENEFIVYPAEDKRMSRLVSIVVPDQSLKADKVRFDRVWASINEAKSFSTLRFVEIEDLIAPSPEDDNFYIVEKRPSKTLRQYLEEQEMIAFDRAVAIGEHVLEGLATLHGAGYAHNALTDQCIYVSEDYSGLSVRIGNLHLISKIGEHIIPPYVPEFGAPEIYAAGTFSASAALDIYAMGMIAYKLFLPRQTYSDVFHSVMVWENEHQREQSWKNIHLDPSNIFPRLDVLVNSFPADLASLVERMLSRDPMGRPRSGADALQEFRHATVGRHFAPPPIIPLGNAKPPVKKWTASKIAMIAALLLICIGVGVFTIPKILGPDPELVKSVEAWKAEAENRRTKAVTAKAPERPAQDEAKLAFDAGSTAMTAGGGSVEKGDYDQALAQYQDAAARFGASLVDIAKDDATKARAVAADAGTEKAPAFADADKRMKAAADAAAADDLRAAIDGYGTAKSGFETLDKAMIAMTAAQKEAVAKHDIADRIGAGDAADFAKANGLVTDSKLKAEQWDLAAATTGYGNATQLFDALIADIMAAKDDAAALKQQVADLSASIVTRGGGSDPQFAGFAPRIADADGRFNAEAYKLAITAYRPLLADLQAFAAQGFCPVSANLAFERVDAGNYPLDNKLRFMTSSLAQLGPMLGVANGAIKVEKPFCMQTRAVTRAEMATYYNAVADTASAQAYADNPGMPAYDVPLSVAESYAAWLSKQLNTSVHVPSAMEWMAGATRIATEKQPDNGDILLQWSTTPCEANGNVAFMAQENSTFVVCSDASAGGLFRVTADLR